MVRRRHQTSTERDINALERIRAERRATPDDEHVIRSDSDGTPDRPYDDKINTGVTHRIRADEDLHRLYVKAEHTRQMLDDGLAIAKRETANLVLEVAGEKPPEQRLGSMEKKIRRWHWIATAIALPALSSLFLVGKYMWVRVENDTRSAIRQEADRELLRELQGRLKHAEDRVRTLEEFQRLNEILFDLKKPKEPPK